MEIKKIVEKNKEFNEWKQNLENEIKTKHQEIIELNKSELSLDAYNKLGYDEAKDVFDVLKFNLEYNSQRQDIVNALNDIKEEAFEILKVAHYYPIINELDYLTDTQKNSVDKLLYMIRVGNYIHTGSQSWYKLRLSNEIENKLLNYLFEKGVVEKCYQLLCSHCSDYIKIITEEEYLNQKKMFDIFDRQRENKVSDEEIQWCEDLMENGGRIWEISCMDCEDEYQEIEKFEQLESRAKIIYKIKAQPDLTYAKK